MTDGSAIPEVDENLCMGYGLCNDYAPGLFVLEGEGVSRVQRDAVDLDDPQTIELIRSAVEGCPLAAIRWADPAEA